MDASQWPQQQVASLERKMEQVATQNNTISSNISANHHHHHHHHHDPTNNNAIRTPPPMVVERRARPQKDQNLNCPRCNSTNTKFCYYNNYSLTQPRYFCKTCRRYWTQGGSLRNVPVGGGSRKNRRCSTSSSTTLAPSSSSSMNVPTIPNKIIPDLNPPSSFPHLITPSQNPKFLEGQDLNLGFPIQGFFQPLDQHQLPKIEANNNNNNENHEPINIMNGNIPNASTTTSCTTSPPSCGGSSGENNHNNANSISALELLRTGIASKGSLSSFVPMPIPDSNTLYPPSGFPNLQEVKPSNIGVFASQEPHHHHHHGNGYEHMIGSGANARLLFPFADMNKLANSTPNHHQHHEIEDQHKGRNDHHQHHHQGPTSGYWTGMLGGGAW